MSEPLKEQIAKLVCGIYQKGQACSVCPPKRPCYVVTEDTNSILSAIRKEIEDIKKENPYRREQVNVDGKSLYKLALSHYSSSDSAESTIYDESLEAILKRIAKTLR